MKYHSAQKMLPSIDALGTLCALETTSNHQIEGIWAPIPLPDVGPDAYQASWLVDGNRFQNKRVSGWAVK